MKSPIEFPEEVSTPSSSSPLPLKSSQAYFDVIGFDYSDCGTDHSTSSTSTESESEIDDIDSSSDFDENDVSYFDSPFDGDDENVAIQNDNSNNNASTPKQTRSVSFGPIHVRQYERIVGDHPGTKVGVPLAIGWAYNVDDEHPDGISIELYEADRIHKGKLRMTSLTRRNMMLNVFEIPEEEIRMAEKRSLKLQKQRAKLNKGANETRLKKLGKTIRKGGMSVLKGMSQTSTFSSGAGLMAY